MGYDTLLFETGSDSRMITLALGGNRVVITRDSQLPKRRVVTSGRLKLILVETDRPLEQLGVVAKAINLDMSRAFTLCVECNRALLPARREDVQDLVPPYVYETQKKYMQCPSCRRVYWQGSHWQAMKRRLGEVVETGAKGSGVEEPG